MDFLTIEQTETVGDTTTDSGLLFIPLDRIIKVLKNKAEWGQDDCVVKLFYEDFSSNDSAIVIVKGDKTEALGRQLGLARDPNPDMPN